MTLAKRASDRQKHKGGGLVGTNFAAARRHRSSASRYKRAAARDFEELRSAQPAYASRGLRSLTTTPSQGLAWPVDIQSLSVSSSCRRSHSSATTELRGRRYASVPHLAVHVAVHHHRPHPGIEKHRFPCQLERLQILQRGIFMLGRLVYIRSQVFLGDQVFAVHID